MDEVKMSLKAINDKLDEVEDSNKKNLNAVNDKLDEMEKNFMEMKEQLGQLATLPDQIRGIQTVQEKMMKEGEETKNNSTNAKHGVLVAGGWKACERLNSVEMFAGARMTWVPLQPMKKCRHGTSSFVYKSRFTVTGGSTGHGLTDSMESIAINPALDSTQWRDSPAKLPSKLTGHSSVVYNGRLIVIGGDGGGKCNDSIVEVLLDPPYTPKSLTRMPETIAYASVELLNGRVFIVGGRKSGSLQGIVDSVIMYDINKNECKEMAPLPFAVSDMATVSWGGNVIIIGGADKDDKALNTVVIYNVQSEKSHMLPAMKYKRKGCVAVVTGNAIVVMGGRDEPGNCLKSVESFNFDRYSWEELSPMNEARMWATAVAW